MHIILQNINSMKESIYSMKWLQQCKQKIEVEKEELTNQSKSE
jgi:hypothetical protein